MTTPSEESPDDALAPEGFAAWQAMTKEDVRAKLRNPLSGFQNAQDLDKQKWSDANTEIVSLWTDVNGLGGRTDLLEGVVAYGNAVMGKNQWLVNSSVPLPFSLTIGPMKGVEQVTTGSGSGFKMLSEGCWRVDVFTLVDGTPFTGSNDCELDIRVECPDGSEYETKRFVLELGSTAPGFGTNQKGTIGGPHSFVVPDPDYRVFAIGRSSRWRRYMGGTLYSMFSINKWDTQVTDQAPSEVDDSDNAPN
ncbi:hypothetical protein [Rhodococcus marinonascens]|uniref:hypothetical protein n=1 Tax=Rhodococcus marinonascens TaxID=38311 RepID=UPI00093268C0|nr:hypothetical protein [Rhodococcus marinonascens]